MADTDYLLEHYVPVVKYHGLNTETNVSFLGDTNVIGNSDKTSYNKVTGYTKIDYRPTGGGTNSYAEQIRFNVGSTSGLVTGLDNETHLVVDGTTSIRSTQGVAVVDTGYTATGSTLIGTYGQARADGTVAGASFMAGLYGLIEEGGGAITASHVASVWADSHRNTAVTGNHELFYGSNNGTATMDQAFYIYGGNKISNLFELNTVVGMTNAANGSGADVYINCTIDGVAVRLAAKYVA